MLNPAGEPIAIGGWLERTEVRALAALVSKQGPQDILDRLFSGEVATAIHEGRTIHMAIAARCVFVIAVADVLSSNLTPLIWSVCDQIADAIRARSSSADTPGGWQPPPGSTGSGSPPAQAFVFLEDLPRRRSIPN